MNFLEDLLGLNEAELSVSQMSLRAFLIFFLAMVYMSIAGVRTLGKKSGFDQITLFIVGALLARSIYYPKSFFSLLAATLVIMVVHRIVAALSARSATMEKLLKGKRVLIFEKGLLKKDKLRRLHISEDDIKEAMHLRAETDDIAKVDKMYLEASGVVTVTRKEE